MDTAQTLQAAAEEDRALGGWGMGILRHMTPSAIKPIVLASKAASQVLGRVSLILRHMMDLVLRRIEESA